jgi:hypothetical protein
MDGARDYEKRSAVLEGRAVGVASYRVGSRFCARIDNVDPGAIIGRGQGSTRAEAEHVALESAALTLNLRDAAIAMRRSAERLEDNKRSK